MSIFKSLLANKSICFCVFILSLILIIGQWLQADIFFNRQDIDQGQWWKVLSGNFTHSNIPHLLLNLSGLFLLMLLFIDSLRAITFILSTFFLSFIVGLGIYLFNPELNGYYGFSGVLYGLFIVAAISAILKNDWFTGFSVAALITLKVLWDLFNGGSQASADLIGIPVANDAHLYGYLGALIISVLLLSQWYLNRKKAHPPSF